MFGFKIFNRLNLILQYSDKIHYMLYSILEVEMTLSENIAKKN